jgi:hypothetical protein
MIDEKTISVLTIDDRDRVMFQPKDKTELSEGLFNYVISNNNNDIIRTTKVNNYGCPMIPGHACIMLFAFKDIYTKRKFEESIPNIYSFILIKNKSKVLDLINAFWDNGDVKLPGVIDSGWLEGTFLLS